MKRCRGLNRSPDEPRYVVGAADRLADFPLPLLERDDQRQQRAGMRVMNPKEVDQFLPIVVFRG